jgi:mannose-1-phosphate guanylyltransferase
MDQNFDALKSAKDFIEEMSNQFIIKSGENEKDAFIKAGLFVMYAWAYINKKQESINELKSEASRLFEKVGNFFHQAEKDIDKMKVENRKYHKAISGLSNEQFDSLLDYVQSKIRIN